MLEGVNYMWLIVIECCLILITLILLKLIKICEEHGIEYIVELYTSFATKLTITGKHPGICDRIKDDIIIDPKNNKIEEFDIIPNLCKYINEDTFNTYDRMVNSDILITSRSCFLVLRVI